MIIKYEDKNFTHHSFRIVCFLNLTILAPASIVLVGDKSMVTPENIFRIPTTISQSVIWLSVVIENFLLCHQWFNSQKMFSLGGICNKVEVFTSHYNYTRK